MTMCPDPSQQLSPGHSGVKRGSALLRLLLPLLIVIISAVIAAWLLQSGPKAKLRSKARNAILVDVRPVVFGPQSTSISIMGTVKARHEVALKPQLSGEITSVSSKLIPGGRFAENEQLLTIDSSDYLLVVKQLASEVARAEADMQLELGRQRVAEKEYELLGETVSAGEKALMLREPQLASSRALLAGARARLERAQLDLQRTTIRAPFNAVVMSREVNRGTRVSPSTTLTTLVGSDSYWVEAPIPASQLQWIATGQQGKGDGSAVRVYDTASWGAQRYRIGQVVGLTAMVEEKGRMAKLLAEIADPLALHSPPGEQPQLLIGSYVRLEITGKTLPRAALIERELIHDGDRLWVMDDKDLLDIRPVEIAFRGQDHVLVTGGIDAGERLVTTNLPSPVQGMSLRLKDAETAAPGGTEKTKP